jgi:hypothetical protein
MQLTPVAESVRVARQFVGSGRGIALVSAMASGWGATPTTAGKVVWFELGR